MRNSIFHIACAVCAVLSLVACNKGYDNVIPRDKMAEIYAEMFVTDQWISSHPQSKRTADTSWVYEPIFEKYGYDSDDYRASVDYYLKDPDRYARILRETSVILDTKIRELRKEKKREKQMTLLLSGIDRHAPDRIYYLTGLGNPGLSVADSLVFYVDSCGGRYDFNPLQWEDTLFSGPVIHIADSLRTAVSDSASALVAEPEPDAENAVSVPAAQSLMSKKMLKSY